MKIAFFDKIISPEIGSTIAGYAFEDYSVAKRDDIYMTGLGLDDGENRALILSFDLQSLDGWFIRRIRRACAELLGTREELVLLSCTHNHSGPEASTPMVRFEKLNRSYLEQLERWILEEVTKLAAAPFREVLTCFYSSYCDENDNRRYTGPDNTASFLPHRRELRELARGFADKEFGEICFLDTQRRDPVYIIGNYAAHPLSGHAPGLGGLTISADYPGVFRRYIAEETGAGSMFISGAAGDMIPKWDEMGSSGMIRLGTALAREALGGVIDAQRNPARFLMEDAKVGGRIGKFTVPIRKQYIGKLAPEYDGLTEATLEIQCLAVGDVCFVGVPGELCAELGQEIKWHAPFRKAFVAYYATAEFSYICPGNFLVSGGYEGKAQAFSSRGGLKLVQCAVDAMYALHEELYPSPGEEPYPDYLEHPLVCLPPNREKLPHLALPGRKNPEK